MSPCRWTTYMNPVSLPNRTLLWFSYPYSDGSVCMLCQVFDCNNNILALWILFLVGPCIPRVVSVSNVTVVARITGSDQSLAWLA